ncbi:hypothetical protein FQ087_18140 [Sporosarcina sp. ANT_H38]|uniref:hypothetical protein n=1 Tax=Sporosarcina sp. ANT_H38 TaxID=2597358 RepID=UPI0011F3A92A|nr:hypothetical protein [Sporosarcina sp. ANT_H38]KAA0944046.1 hypothetical protein FQ087_18140 [Sporosarcina sp. ANT_H38]
MIGRKTKSISFDLTDEYEKGLLEFAESKEDKGKFSRYIKRLIAQDRDGSIRTSSMPVMPEIPVMEEQEEDEDDTMGGFL